MTIKTIFLDRDGVINKDIGYLHKIKDCLFIDDIFESCKHFQNLGYEIIIVSNQSGIQRGFYSELDLEILNKWMLKQFIKNNIQILDFFYCPHGVESNCKCRKPEPGMFFKAKDKYDVDFNASWMIGDKETDVIAANKAGINNTILFKTDSEKTNNKTSAKYVIENLYQTKSLITL